MARSASPLTNPQPGPYEVCLSAALLVLGMVAVVGAAISKPINGTLSTFDLMQRYAYGALAIMGATLTLIGLMLIGTLIGTLIERAGQYVLGFGAAVFVAVQLSAGDPPAYSLVMNGAIGIAAFWRVLQITVNLRNWHSRVTDAIAAIEELGGSVTSKGEDE